MTEWDDRFENAHWHVAVEATPENGLSKKSSADTFQVWSISEKRLVRRLGTVSEQSMSKIGEGLALSLALEP